MYAIRYPHEILTRPANEFVESLVGQNRILKKFSLMRCGGFSASAPFFPIEAAEDILAVIRERPVGRTTLASSMAMALPLGLLPVGDEENDRPLADRMRRHRAVVQEEQTLYDALSLLFSTGDKSIFCVDEQNRVKALIGIAQLYPAVDQND